MMKLTTKQSKMRFIFAITLYIVCLIRLSPSKKSNSFYELTHNLTIVVPKLPLLTELYGNCVSS